MRNAILVVEMRGFGPQVRWLAVEGRKGSSRENTWAVLEGRAEVQQAGGASWAEGGAPDPGFLAPPHHFRVFQTTEPTAVHLS